MIEEGRLSECVIVRHPNYKVRRLKWPVNLQYEYSKDFIVKYAVEELVRHQSVYTEFVLR